jgi:hypothetical protein
LKHIILLITLLFLVACNSNPETPGEHTLEVSEGKFVSEDNMFRLTMYLDKLEFNHDEKINIHSTLEYIGKKNNITIWHGYPYINYTITDGKNFRTGGTTMTILTSSQLKNGEIYEFPYKKTGGFSEEDSNADFLREFYKEKDLYLPKGKYKVIVYCDFSLNEDSPNNDYNNQIEVEITVK